MTAHVFKRSRGFVLVALIVAVAIAPGCGAGINATAIALSGTYNVLDTPTGTNTGTAIVANGLLTTWLSITVTNPQSPTVNGNQISWVGTISDPATPFLSVQLTVLVTNQGNGTLTGTASLGALGQTLSSSQVTMQLQ